MGEKKFMERVRKNVRERKILQGLSLVQVAMTNAGCKKTEKTPTGEHRYFIFLVVGSKYSGIPKISFLSTPEVGEKQWMEKERREKEQKYVLTMANWPAMLVNITTGGERTPPRPIFAPVLDIMTSFDEWL